MKRTQSSNDWLKEHFLDPYVKMAQQQGFRSRAAFKLLEINERDRIIQPGMFIVDLGSAPGGWCQMASRLLKGRGQIIALDRLAMPALPGVTFIQGDFREDEVLKELELSLNNHPVDLVLSDMAPNMSGMDGIDQPKVMYLAELALAFAVEYLKEDGDFLVKVFQGADFDAYLKHLKHYFKKVVIRKPKSSRARSAEQFLLARGKKNIASL